MKHWELYDHLEVVLVKPPKIFILASDRKYDLSSTLFKKTKIFKRFMKFSSHL